MELNPNGCARLAHAVVSHALTNDSISPRSPYALKRRAEELGAFKKSIVIDLFAEAYQIAPERVRGALDRRIAALFSEAYDHEKARASH